VTAGGGFQTVGAIPLDGQLVRSGLTETAGCKRPVAGYNWVCGMICFTWPTLDQLSLAAAPPLFFIVFHKDGILLAGSQGDGRAGVFGGALIDPTVDDLLAVDPEPGAVIAGGGRRCRSGNRTADLAGPADGEGIC